MRGVTGKGLTTSIALQLTDLGIMRWDADRNCIVAMFGDSFSFGWGQDWRSPVLACFDTDFNCLGVPVEGGIATQPARQLWEYAHNNPDYSTVLPCDFIRIGNVWHVAVMLTKGLGNETMTEFWHSTDLVNWELTGFGFAHPGSDPHTTMLSFDQFGDWIYVVGTHGLRRDGNVKMWRCRADEFPKGTWEPCNNGQPILYGKHGELCLRNVDGNAVLGFFDAARYCVAAICVASPDDSWPEGNRITVATGRDLPQLYGGYIAPGSKLNEPDGMKFWVSQWLTANNSAYHVVAYSGTLAAQGPIEGKPSYSEVMELSENGWPGLPVSADMLEWARVPGCTPKVTVQVAKGAPSIILRAFVADWNAYIEPVDDATTGGFRAQDSVHNSNHRSGTAVDVNHTKHPFQVSNAGFDQQQIGTMKELLAYYEDTVFWGQAWGEQGIGPFDAMHIQMGGNTYNSPKTQDFIGRKIRPDGLSKFRRGDMPAVDTAALLSEVMGGSLSLDRYRELVPAFAKFLHAANCTTPERIAMAAAQLGHESGGLRYQREIADGSAYEGRRDLGNTQPGDGRRFRGAGWIQTTGRGNVTRCSQWAFDQGLVPSPTYFLDNPDQLASDEYCWLSPAWYWTVARPQLNDMSDRRDLEAATRAINGGLNGLADRRSRYNKALSMGDRLLGLTSATVALVKEERLAVEKVLNWDKSITSQQYYWSCGPATTQILLSIRGIAVSEDELVRVVGATVNGTDAISQIELKALDRYCPEAQYTTVWLPNDPPTKDQVETFWKHLKASIDHGYGVAQNWVAPPSNRPRPVHGSTDIPNFYKRGTTVYHYIAATGYAEENGQRFVRIGDPGGRPNEYWVTLEQNVGLMTPKGYVWAAAFKPVVQPPVQPPVQAPVQPVQPPVQVSVQPPVSLGMEVEWNAFLGDTDSILTVLRAALSTDAATKDRAIRVLKVVPKDALQAVAQALKG